MQHQCWKEVRNHADESIVLPANDGARANPKPAHTLKCCQDGMQRRQADQKIDLVFPRRSLPPKVLSVFARLVAPPFCLGASL